jgi:tRNA G10  N-methylase Trm11
MKKHQIFKKLIFKVIIKVNKYCPKFFTDKFYLKVLFKVRLNKKLNLKNPKTFNEKLQWLKLYDRKLEYTEMVDKYEVRKYIEKTIGSEFLVPLFGIYDSFDEIDFNKLPNEFVLKCTHDSGGVVICKDKKKFDMSKARNKLEKNMKRNFYYTGREWPYKNVKPRIICEKYLNDGINDDLLDYKFMCFNGKVKCMFVCLNRNKSTGLNVDFYDLNWNKMPFERHYQNSNTKLLKPRNFNRMIELSEKLSNNIPFIRVDFYEVNGKIYFGELTFYPGSGLEEFIPDEYDNIIGEWLKL